MSWFGKKEKKPCTNNTLCIHISEDVLLSSIERLVELNFNRRNAILKKKREESEDLYYVVLDEINNMIYEQYPWVKNWTLRTINHHHRVPEYFLDITKHTLFDNKS